MNPESAEFVPKAKLNQPDSRRSYRQSNHNQDWRANHVRPHHHLRQSNATNQGGNEFENPTDNTLPPPELAFRGGLRGRGGRPRGGRGTGDNDHRPQIQRWIKPVRDGNYSGRDRGHDRPNTPTSNRSADEENKERATLEFDGREPYRDNRWKKPNKTRVERLTKEPMSRDQEENLENQAAGRDTKPVAVYEHPEPEQRSHKGWRGGDHRMQPNSRRKGPAPSHGIEGNWREREPVQMRENEKRGAEDESGRPEEANRNRRGMRGKQTPLQNIGPKRGGGPERRTGPVKRMEPPKSKETQTGEVICLPVHAAL